MRSKQRGTRRFLSQITVVNKSINLFWNIHVQAVRVLQHNFNQCGHAYDGITNRPKVRRIDVTFPTGLINSQKCIYNFFFRIISLFIARLTAWSALKLPTDARDHLRKTSRYHIHSNALQRNGMEWIVCFLQTCHPIISSREMKTNFQSIRGKGKSA